jgi:hypothetical protein
MKAYGGQAHSRRKPEVCKYDTKYSEKYIDHEGIGVRGTLCLLFRNRDILSSIFWNLV